MEGCSNKTVHYYESTIRNAVEKIDKDVMKITTDDLRMFLDGYQEENGSMKNRVGSSMNQADRYRLMSINFKKKYSSSRKP